MNKVKEKKIVSFLAIILMVVALIVSYFNFNGEYFGIMYSLLGIMIILLIVALYRKLI